jgi:hypothetical protein
VKGAEPPWEWVESRLCEEFGCLPSQLDQEDPERLFEIAGLRGYARAKQALDSAESETDVKRTGMVEQVWKIQAEIIKDRRARRGS